MGAPTIFEFLNQRKKLDEARRRIKSLLEDRYFQFFGKDRVAFPYRTNNCAIKWLGLKRLKVGCVKAVIKFW